MKLFILPCFSVLIILFLSLSLTQADYTLLKNITNVTILDSSFPVVRQQLGLGVNIMGDFNGDNISDIVIASKNIISVILGNSSLSSTLDFSNMSTPLIEFQLTDIYNGPLVSSLTIQAGGDINGDGFDDLIIAPYANLALVNLTGVILYGGPEFGKSKIDADNLTSDQGSHFFISGGGNQGFCFSPGKDVNKDGFADIILGCTGNSTVIILFGSQSLPTQLDLSALTPDQGLIIDPSTWGVAVHHFGYAVSWAGDLDGDGIEDIMIANSNDSPFDRSLAGTVLLFYGHLSNNKYTVENNTSNPLGFDGFSIYGDESDDYLGSSFASVGDVNKDGLDDMLIGTVSNAFIIYGSTQRAYAGIDLANSTQTTGASTKFNGTTFTGPSTNIGVAVSKTGDYNGDGINDILIGNPKGENCTPIACGNAYIIFGQEGVIPNIDLLNIASSQGIALHNSGSGDQLGYSVSGGGDVDGNGSSDVIISSPGSNTIYLLLTGVSKENPSNYLWAIILGTVLVLLLIAFFIYKGIRKSQAHKSELIQELKTSALEEEDDL